MVLRLRKKHLTIPSFLFSKESDKAYGKTDEKISISKLTSLKARLLSRPEIGVITSVALVMTIFTALNPQFIYPASLASIVSVGSEVGIVTVGVSVLLLAGEFDISTGGILAISEITMAMLIARFSMPPIISLAVMLMLGALIGFVNGVITLKGHMPSFIATLGMLFFLSGMGLLLTGAFPITAHGGALFPILNGKFLGDFRTAALWLLVLVIVASVLMTKTKLGNWITCTGGDPNVAKAMGIKTDRVKIICFMISGTCAAFAGAIALGRFNTVTASTGTQTGLEAVASAVMGGVALSGGYGSVIGAALGAFLLGMIRMGMIMAGAPAFWYSALVGIVLIAATQLNVLTSRRGKKK